MVDSIVVSYPTRCAMFEQDTKCASLLFSSGASKVTPALPVRANITLLPPLTQGRILVVGGEKLARPEVEPGTSPVHEGYPYHSATQSAWLEESSTRTLVSHVLSSPGAHC